MKLLPHVNTTLAERLRLMTLGRSAFEASW